MNIPTEAGPAICPVSAGGHVSSGQIRLAVNGAVKQDADIADLIWDCAETIAYVTRFGRLLPGDLILRHPVGVSAVVPGDVIDVTIVGLAPLRVTIGKKEADSHDPPRFPAILGELPRPHRPEPERARI